jgi:hypothetical protein
MARLLRSQYATSRKVHCADCRDGSTSCAAEVRNQRCNIIASLQGCDVEGKSVERSLLLNLELELATQRNGIDVLVEGLTAQQPVVLFAGQAFPNLGNGDSILSALFERLSLAGDGAPSWPAIFQKGEVGAHEFDWLSERFERNVFSEAVQAVLNMSWSAVFTTSIDPSIARRLETLGRRPEQVLARDHYARVARSRSRPPVYYLYGKANETPDENRAPRTRAELKRRESAHVSEFLNRLCDTVTGHGILVIDGFEAGRDWLALDSLLAPLSAATGIVTIWFGAPEDPESDFYEDMVRSKMLIPEPNRLAHFVAQIETVSRQATQVVDGPGVVSLRSGHVLDIAPALRLRVEASAAIIDDLWTDETDSLGAADSNGSSFWRFHGDLGGLRGLIDGILRGYAIERDFEHNLRKRVDATLESATATGGVIIVHGQSGSGKSVSLGRLAIAIRQSIKAPVLFATSRLPPATDVDAFCSEAERAGATVTLVVIDANQSATRYRDLAAALASRGRRVVIVGSSYRVDVDLQDKESRQQMIEAPSFMSAKEQTELRALVTKYEGGRLPDLKLDSLSDTNALALLYRTLSAGRGRIVAGVAQEARFAEHQIRDRARDLPVVVSRSALADQLIALKLYDPHTSLFETDAEDQLEALGQDAAGRLIDYVMAAGRLDCAVPLNLLLRVLNGKELRLEPTQILHLFKDLDLFRWREYGQEGNDYAIAPRIQLEAELICRRRLADTSKEIECLIDLIRGVRAFGVDRSSERQFLIDLLDKMDRDGPRGDVYSIGYRAIADALRSLRISNLVVDATLMLQESFFYRRAIWANDGPYASSVLDEEDRYRILNSARETVESAMSLISEGKLHASSRTRQSIKNERASIYGFLAVQSSQKEHDVEQTWSSYLAAREASRQAMAIANSYYPVDVALWTQRDILSASVLPKELQAELLADIYSTLDLVRPDDLPSEQKTKYLERRAGIAITLGNKALADEAIAGLYEVVPAAAIFLTARNKASALFEDGVVYGTAERFAAKSVADYLSDQRKRGLTDERCARLYLRLRWAEVTGDVILREARGKTPCGDGVVGDLLEVVTELNQFAADNVRSADRYLEAVLAWLAHDTARADEIWGSLSRDTEYEDRSRIIRRLVVSDESGEPKMFRGRVEGAKRSNQEHWRVRVEGVNGTVVLLQRDFPDDDIRPGRELRDFAIAFNYVGPIADPISKAGKR